MNVAVKRNVIEHLWENQRPEKMQVYALLDGAQNDDIYRHVVSSGLDSVCLYSGKLAPPLARVAPYLVKLSRHHEFTKTIVMQGWGKNWGIFVRSAAPLSELRKHFHGFLTVQDDEGKRLVFRYYDPRIFRVYLPTCRLNELKTVFGPVEDFMLEAEDPYELILYRLNDDRLAVEQHSLVDAFSATLPAENLSP